MGKLRARSRKDKVSDLAEEKKSKKINTYFYVYRNTKSIITFCKPIGYLIFTHHCPIQNCRTNSYSDWMFLILMDWCCYAHNGSFIVSNATRGYFGGWIFALQWNSLIPIFKVCNLSPCHHINVVMHCVKTSILILDTVGSKKCMSLYHCRKKRCIINKQICYNSNLYKYADF